LIRFLAFSIKRAWQGFWRNIVMSLAATATMVLMLLLLAGLLIVVTGLNAGLDQARSEALADGVEELVVLHGDLPKEQQAVTLKMLQQLNRMPLEHQRYFLSLLKSLRR